MIKLNLILLFLFSSVVNAQKRDTIIIPQDTSSFINTRVFSEDLSKKYSDKDFDYSSTEGEAQNLLSRFLFWLKDTLNNTFGISIPPSALKFIEYFIYFLMGALAIYLLVKFLIKENFSTLLTKKANTIIDVNLSEKHIEQINLDNLLSVALEQKNYRLAVRYHYLKVLKNLSFHNIIEWQFEKTNADYQKEIKHPKISSLFKEVSYLYEHIWYGEQDINNLKFNSIEARFEALKNSLNH